MRPGLAGLGLGAYLSRMEPIDLRALGYELVKDVRGARPFWRIVHAGPPRQPLSHKPKISYKERRKYRPEDDDDE